MKSRPSSKPQLAAAVPCQQDQWLPKRKAAGAAAKVFAALTLSALLGAHGAASGQPDVGTQPRLGEAMDAYERCQWAAAFSQLAGLADGGHAESARIALLMARFGPTMYASRFDTSPQQRERWLALAARSPQQIAQRTTD